MCGLAIGATVIGAAIPLLPVRDDLRKGIDLGMGAIETRSLNQAADRLHDKATHGRNRAWDSCGAWGGGSVAGQDGLEAADDGDGPRYWTFPAFLHRSLNCYDARS
jgi:hypothetical protein